MKKTILFLFAGLFAAFAVNGQTPTNFNTADCNSVNHDLFSELSAGKVVVISFVMPCSSCVGPSLTAMNVVNSYASSNPGQVFFYIADDQANTSCTSLNSWVNANGLSGTITFSSSLVAQSDYGSGGMPKIVVLGGGSNPTTYFNQNGSAAGNSTALQTAINSAIAAVGIDNPSSSFNTLSLAPNPATEFSTISFTKENSNETNIEIFNQLGQKVMTVFNETVSPGENKIQLNVAEFANGTYFVRISDADNSSMIKMVIAH